MFVTQGYRSRLFITVLLTCSWLLAAVPTTPTHAEDRIGAMSNFTENRLDGEQKAKSNYGRLPLRFEPNVGQRNLPDSVKYVTRSGAMSLFLTDSSAVFALTRPQPRPVDPQDKDYLAAKMHQPVDESTSAYLDSLPGGVAIYMRWLGGAALPPSVVEMEASDKQPGITNYFIGNDPAKWRTNIAGFAKATYREIYPGIGLAFYGNNNQLEYDFIVEPLADPSQIRLSFEGADSLRLNEQGDLIIGTPLGELRQALPQIYQQQAGQKKPIAGRYVLRPTVGVEGTTLPEIGFEVDSYDPTLPLIIDPLIYSTYLGGLFGDLATGVAVDSDGNAYVTGDGDGPDFPTTPGAFDTIRRGTFVTKLDASGTNLLYSTFVAGTRGDFVYAIALDSSGNAYITGQTMSPDFPTTPGSFDTTYNGGNDAFITKLNANGTALIYSTYLGGSSYDVGSAIKVHADNTAYVIGTTWSSDFPTTSGAFNTTYRGQEAVISKLNANGTKLVYSTFLGGSSAENGITIAIDSSGDAYVGGYTYSSDFPTTIGAFDTTYIYSTSFISKLNANGSALIYSTYMGESSISALEVDGNSNAYLIGSTNSPDFPTTSGAFDTSYNDGNNDAFVTKLNANGTALIYSTYLGGSSYDVGSAIKVHADNTAYVSGHTYSTDFPTTTGAFDTSFNFGLDDAYVTKLNANGSALLYSSYLGGNKGDFAEAIAIETSGNVYVVGYTYSSDFPTNNGAFDVSIGYLDAFVTKLNPVADCRAVTSTTDNNDCGTLQRAVNDAATLGGKVIFNLPANSQINLGSALTIPLNVEIEANCNNRVQINASLANAVQLTGGNRVQGLDIRTTVGTGLKNIGTGNVLVCTSVGIVASP